MASPRLSVIVPVYNGARFLSASLECLLKQTFRDFELLVIDDGSTDSSPQIVQGFRDPRIRYVRQENQGLCHALNRGIKEASAPVIARNDQDDLSVLERLERQLGLLEGRPDAVALITHYTKFGARRTWSNVDKQGAADASVMEIEPLRDGCLLGSTMMARAEALRRVGGYRQECYPCDDYDLEMRLSQIGTVLLLRQPLVKYRFHVSANTYPLFATMQNKSRWVEDCHKRRVQKQAELGFEDFMRNRNLSSAEGKRERRLDAAKLHMRVAGQRYLDGLDLSAAYHFCASTILDPSTVLNRVRRAFRFRKPSRAGTLSGLLVAAVAEASKIII